MLSANIQRQGLARPCQQRLMPLLPQVCPLKSSYQHSRQQKALVLQIHSYAGSFTGKLRSMAVDNSAVVSG